MLQSNWAEVQPVTGTAFVLNDNGEGGQLPAVLLLKSGSFRVTALLSLAS